MLKGHGLKLNSDFFFNGGPAQWNASAIRERAEWLMGHVVELWPQMGDDGRKKPKFVIILGKTNEVKSWRDVVRTTAEFVYKNNVLWGFEKKIVKKAPSYFSRQRTSEWSYQLGKDWWVKTNLDAEDAEKLCKTMIVAAGMSEKDFDVEFW